MFKKNYPEKNPPQILSQKKYFPKKCPEILKKKDIRKKIKLHFPEIPQTDFCKKFQTDFCKIFQMDFSKKFQMDFQYFPLGLKGSIVGPKGPQRCS